MRNLALAIILQPLGFPEANTSVLITEPKRLVHVIFARDLTIFQALHHNVTLVSQPDRRGHRRG
jgi:hypothetical protein